MFCIQSAASSLFNKLYSNNCGLDKMHLASQQNINNASNQQFSPESRPCKPTFITHKRQLLTVTDLQELLGCTRASDSSSDELDSYLTTHTHKTRQS